MPQPCRLPIFATQENELNMSRRGLFLTVFGGTAGYWFALNGGLPVSTVDPKKNVALLKTKGGNTIAATQARVRLVGGSGQQTAAKGRGDALC